MKYTVKQLAKLSGVTGRTLRYYDEIDLLTPAHVDEENHYRYYGEAELLTLQQILFFRSLGFPLDNIRTVIKSDNFDKITALSQHKAALAERIEKMQTLINTVDKTLLHLKREITMNETEMYEGFDLEQQIEYENYLKEKCPGSEALLDQSWTKAKDLSKDDWLKFQQSANEINVKLVNAIEQGLTPDSPAVQAIIQTHYNWVCHFWTPNKETYIGLSQMYQDHPEFKEFYTEPHPELLEFITKAMAVFAEQLP